MSEIFNDFCKKATFFEFEGIICVAKEHEYIANVHGILLWEFQKYDDIV